MTVLVVGISHRSAPIPLLEQLAVDTDGATKLIEDLLANPHVSEATVVATCNRIEIYADVDRFHGSVEDLSQRLLARRRGQASRRCCPTSTSTTTTAPSPTSSRSRPVSTRWRSARAQILGQTRDALGLGQELGSVGPTLNTLFQQALRVGKRAHAETDIDRAAPTLVSAALDRAIDDVCGPSGRGRRCRRHGRPRRRHGRTPRSRRGRRRQPHAGARRATGRRVRRPLGRR